MTPQQGDIVLIPFPYTDLAATKRRPVLVLRSADRSGDFLAVAITSQRGHEDAVTLSQGDFRHGALPRESYVRTTKLYTLNTCVVVHRFGALAEPALKRILATICIATGCSP